VLVLNKESVAPIETARGVLSLGFSATHIKVYKGDSNAASISAGNPAEQVLAEELEAPGGPGDASARTGYQGRESQPHRGGRSHCGVAAVDVNKPSTNKPAPQ